MSLFGVPSLLAVLLAGYMADMPDAMLEQGGVTFDFELMSAERFPDIAFDTAQNFFGDAWNGVVSNSPTRVVALPHDRGGKYRVICTTRVAQTKPDSVAVMIRFGSGATHFAEACYRLPVWCPVARRPDRWRQMTKVFEARRGETHLQVTFHSKNAVVEVKEFAIVPEKESPSAAASGPVVVHNIFTPNVDGRFAVGTGQVGELGFIWKRTPGADVAVGDTLFKVELPKGISYAGATFANQSTVKKQIRPDGSSVTTFRGNEKVVLAEDWRWYKAGYLMVAAEDSAAGGAGRLKIVGKDAAGKPFEASSETIEFFAAKPVNGSQPKRFGTVSMVRDMVDLRDPDAIERFARFIQSMGVNWLMPAPEGLQPALQVLRRHGISRITPQDCNWLRNGYEIARDQVPEDERFVGVPWPWRDYSRYDRKLFCPLAISEMKPFFRTNSFAKVAALLKGTDGISCNWEPAAVQGRGCVCSHCLKAFAAHLGRSVEEVSAGWPTNVLGRHNGVWAKEGERFRSLQHAQAIKMLNRLVTKITGGERSLGLVPEVFFGHFTSGWRDRHVYPEAQEIDYAEDFAWFQLWAPYVPWRTNGPYLNERGRRLACWAAAQNVRMQMSVDYPAGKRPKVCGTGAGPLDGYMMQPEEIAMETLAYFFNRFDATGPWEFPAGSDARYHRAFAGAATMIAKYEDVVIDGEDVTKDVALETDRRFFGTPVNAIIPRWLPTSNDMSQLQHVAFGKDALTIVAAFNAWQEGEAFFRLKAVVPSGRYKIVSDDGVVWAGVSPDGSWTHMELAQGVPLAVGACRCRVFEICPVEKNGLTAATHRMSQRRLAEIFASRRMALAEAAKRDAELAKYDIYGPSKVD